jgi:hypothetical protein
MNIESATSKNAESKQERVAGHLAEAKCCSGSKQESVSDHLVEVDIGVAEEEIGHSKNDGRISEGDEAKILEEEEEAEGRRDDTYRNENPEEKKGEVDYDTYRDYDANDTTHLTRRREEETMKEAKKRGRKERRVWKESSETQTQDETPATDSEKSERRLDQRVLIKTFKGLQHTLHSLTQGIKELIRNKKWAQKAHAGRERRRAARQKEVGYQPSQFPADSPLGQQRNVSTADIESKSAEAGIQPPTEDWTPPTELRQGDGWESLGSIGPTAGNRETGGPVETGDQERPRGSEDSPRPAVVTKIREEDRSSNSEESEDDSSEILPGTDVRMRDACRLIRVLRKISYEIRGRWKGKPKKEEKKAYKAFITLEDQVGVHHLRHRVGKMEELQTTLSHPHQFRKTLIRVYRLKNLRWSLLHVDREGNRARMPELM